MGIHAANLLKVIFKDNPAITVVDTAEHGVVLLEYFIGFDKAVLIDAIQTGQRSPGTVFEIDSSDLKPVITPSPHFTGIPELFRIAEQLEIEFPKEIKIVAMEVEDLSTLGGGLSDSVADSLPELVRTVEEMVHRWG
jgi:hydrogenase maturation protease